MNERIKELIKEAGEVYQEDVWSGVGVYEFNKEKFAELIVRECATLAFDGPNGILEHFGFGVEE